MNRLEPRGDVISPLVGPSKNIGRQTLQEPILQFEAVIWLLTLGLPVEYLPSNHVESIFLNDNQLGL